MRQRVKRSRSKQAIEGCGIPACGSNFCMDTMNYYSLTICSGSENIVAYVKSEKGDCSLYVSWVVAFFSKIRFELMQQVGSS